MSRPRRKQTPFDLLLDQHGINMVDVAKRASIIYGKKILPQSISAARTRGLKDHGKCSAIGQSIGEPTEVIYAAFNPQK